MKRPLKNLLALAAGDLGSRLLGFLINVYLARVLLPSAFGVMNIGLSVLGYLALVASPGMQVLEARNSALVAGADEQRVNSVLSLRLVLALGCVVVTGIASLLLISPAEVRESVILFALCLLPMAMFLDWFFQGKEQFTTLSIAKLITYGCYGIIVLLFVHSKDDIVWIPLGLTAGYTLATLFLFGAFRRFGAFAFVWRPDEWRRILAGSVPVGVASFLAQSAINLPPLALGWFVATAQAGVFSAALKVVFAMLMLDRLLNALLLPVLTRYASAKREELSFLLSVVVKSVLALTLPLTVGSALLAAPIITVIFGSSYGDAAVLLQILMGYFLFTVLNSVCVCTLIAFQKEKEYTSALNTGSLVLVTGILAGTLLGEAQGAALGVVLGEGVTLALMVVRANATIRLPLLRLLLAPLGATLAMGAVVLALREQPAALQALLGIIAFIMIMIVTRGIDAREIQFLRERLV